MRDNIFLSYNNAENSSDTQLVDEVEGLASVPLHVSNRRYRSANANIFSHGCIK